MKLRSGLIPLAFIATVVITDCGDVSSSLWAAGHEATAVRLKRDGQDSCGEGAAQAGCRGSASSRRQGGAPRPTHHAVRPASIEDLGLTTLRATASRSVACRVRPGPPLT